MKHEYLVNTRRAGAYTIFVTDEDDKAEGEGEDESQREQPEGDSHLAFHPHREPRRMPLAKLPHELLLTLLVHLATGSDMIDVESLERWGRVSRFAVSCQLSVLVKNACRDLPRLPVPPFA